MSINLKGVLTLAKNTNNAQDKVTQKVIILYICEKIDSLNKQELMQIALESMYMDYFQFTTILDELISEDLISGTYRKSESSNRNTSERFSLTSKGAVILDTLRSNIPVAVTRHLNEILSKNNEEIERSESIITNIKPLEDGTYTLELSLSERQDPYFSITINTPNREISSQLENNFKNNAADIYAKVMGILHEYNQADDN